MIYSNEKKMLQIKQLHLFPTSIMPSEESADTAAERTASKRSVLGSYMRDYIVPGVCVVGGYDIQHGDGGGVGDFMIMKCID